MNLIKKRVEEHKTVIDKFFDSCAESIDEASKLIINAFNSGNKLLIFGNGGSAADSQHIAAEFVNRFLHDRNPLPAIALTTDTSTLTSIGNDSGFSYVFEKQIKALGKKGDIALAITTSDISKNHSSNLAFALRAAKEQGLKTIGLVSQKSKDILDYLDCAIVIPSKETPRIQEAHILAAHLICEIVEKEFLRKIF